MAELADAEDLKSSGSDTLWVQVPPAPLLFYLVKSVFYSNYIIMQLFFIRHAQSENNALWLRTGSHKSRKEDPDLSTDGKFQLKYLKKYLSSILNNKTPFTHLYTSPMVRAVKTGIVVSNVIQLPLVAWIDLHETGGIVLEDEQTGEMVGMPGNNRYFFQQHFPELILPASIDGKGWWNRPYESEKEQIERAKRVINLLLEKHNKNDDKVVIISHCGFYNVLVRTLLGLQNEDSYWFELNNAAMTRIDFIQNRIIFVFQNQNDYMPEKLIS